MPSAQVSAVIAFGRPHPITPLTNTSVPTTCPPHDHLGPVRPAAAGRATDQVRCCSAARRRVRWLGDAGSGAQPISNPHLVNLTRRDGEHRHFRLIDIGRIRLPPHIVEIEEHHECSSRRTLVAIGKRMVPGEPANQHRGLLDQVDVELMAGRTQHPAHAKRSRPARSGWT
jgi:hypothetical protein